MTEAIWYRMGSPPRPAPPPPPQKKKKKKKKKTLHNHSDRLKSCLYDNDFKSCFRLFYGSLLCLPPVRVGRHIVFPLASVCLCVCVSVGLWVCGSVCLSVTKSCPLYNLITVTDISTKLHTFVKHIETTCHAQEP